MCTPCCGDSCCNGNSSSSAPQGDYNYNDVGNVPGSVSPVVNGPSVNSTSATQPPENGTLDFHPIVGGFESIDHGSLLQAISSQVSTMVKLWQQFKRGQQEMEDLLNFIEHVVGSIETQCQIYPERLKGLNRRIEELSRDINRVQTFIVELMKRNRVNQLMFLFSGADKPRIKRFQEEIKASLDRFNVASTISIQATIHRITEEAQRFDRLEKEGTERHTRNMLQADYNIAQNYEASARRRLRSEEELTMTSTTSITPTILDEVESQAGEVNYDAERLEGLQNDGLEEPQTIKKKKRNGKRTEQRNNEFMAYSEVGDVLLPHELYNAQPHGPYGQLPSPGFPPIGAAYGYSGYPAYPAPPYSATPSMATMSPVRFHLHIS
ncbi:hypothetical protein GALMADRAFT_235356 [Galerina marginata CBS 339.88]|uniref:Uncharacterized protein n=1 Tax=Galerina marginata (strain CBS 339.88) TaxID=685588 RepID=A0A067U1G0_GALM3|nr:hypothetical protein GALMADRAFT_235356 [Galerina marginata CBS 339.88]